MYLCVFKIIFHISLSSRPFSALVSPWLITIVNLNCMPRFDLRATMELRSNSKDDAPLFTSSRALFNLSLLNTDTHDVLHVSLMPRDTNDVVIDHLQFNTQQEDAHNTLTQIIFGAVFIVWPGVIFRNLMDNVWASPRSLGIPKNVSTNLWTTFRKITIYDYVVLDGRLVESPDFFILPHSSLLLLPFFLSSLFFIFFLAQHPC